MTKENVYMMGGPEFGWLEGLACKLQDIVGINDSLMFEDLWASHEIKPN
jgi:hypothetical protein